MTAKDHYYLSALY